MYVYNYLPVRSPIPLDDIVHHFFSSASSLNPHSIHIHEHNSHSFPASFLTVVFASIRNNY